MPTEDDLRTTFQALEAEAPDPVWVLVELDDARRRRRGRRTVVATVSIAASVAVLATLAIVVPTLSRGPDSPTPPVASALEDEMLNFTFAVDPVPGYQIVYQSRGVSQQQAMLYADGQEPFYLTVHSPGTFTDVVGDTVQVHGRPAYLNPNTAVGCLGNKTGAALTWEYAPDSWAQVERPATTAPDEEQLIRIAEAVDFDRTTPVRLPIKIDALPYDLQPARIDSVTGGLAEPSGPSATITLVNSGDLPIYLRITATPDANVQDCADTMRTSERRVLDHGAYSVIVDAIPGEFAAVVADEIEFVGDGTDQRTWPVAAEALPII